MNRPNYLWIVTLTFVMAIVLTLLPMPDWAIWFRPTWVLLVLIYWTMRNPYLVNMGTAWFLGIIIDVLNGTLIGEHALAFTVAIYFVIRMHTQLRMHTKLQQSIYIGLFILTNQFILFFVQGLQSQAPLFSLTLLPAFTSALLWPWISYLLRDYERKV
jgi:rod shape-determining protein MreD